LDLFSTGVFGSVHKPLLDYHHFSLAVITEPLNNSMNNNSENGMVHLSSAYSFSETLLRLESLLKSKGLTVFCRVDHSGEAEKAGLKMNPTQLVIFGSPKAGTAVMVASPTLAIDLPLKVLIWEDTAGKVWVSYNSPEYLKQRHNIPDELVKNIAGIGPLLESVVK
jgi:uncharacterized protein (DUF302 family)